MQHIQRHQPATAAQETPTAPPGGADDLLAAYIRRTNQVLIAYDALARIEAAGGLRRAEIARAALLTMGPYSSEEQPT